jgi:hypothetical protein
VSETHTHTYSERILSELSLWPRPGGAPGACARAGQLDLNLESYGCTWSWRAPRPQPAPDRGVESRESVESRDQETRLVSLHMAHMGMASRNSYTYYIPIEFLACIWLQVLAPWTLLARSLEAIDRQPRDVTFIYSTLVPRGLARGLETVPFAGVVFCGSSHTVRSRVSC